MQATLEPPVQRRGRTKGVTAGKANMRMFPQIPLAMLILASFACAADAATTQPTSQDSIDNFVPTHAPANSPKVQIRLIVVEADGGQHPLVPAPEGTELYFNDKGGTWRATFVVRGNPMQTAVGPAPEFPALAWDKTYVIVSRGKTGEVRIPKVADGQIERVEVVLKEPPPAPVVEAPRIDGVVKGLPPAKAGEANWRIGYMWGTEPWKTSVYVRSANIGADGSFTLADAPLGGDLLVHRGEGLCFAFVRNVQKRTIHVPDDAGFLGNAEQAIACRLAFSRKRLPQGAKAVAFALDARDKYPVAATVLPTDGSEVAVLLPVGSYQVRVVCERLVPWRGPASRSAPHDVSEEVVEVLDKTLDIAKGASVIWITEKD